MSARKLSSIFNRELGSTSSAKTGFFLYQGSAWYLRLAKSWLLHLKESWLPLPFRRKASSLNRELASTSNRIWYLLKEWSSNVLHWAGFSIYQEVGFFLNTELVIFLYQYSDLSRKKKMVFYLSGKFVSYSFSKKLISFPSNWHSTYTGNVLFLKKWQDDFST